MFCLYNVKYSWEEDGTNYAIGSMKIKTSTAVLGSGPVPANLSDDFREHGMSC